MTPNFFLQSCTEESQDDDSNLDDELAGVPADQLTRTDEFNVTDEFNATDEILDVASDVPSEKNSKVEALVDLLVILYMAYPSPFSLMI